MNLALIVVPGLLVGLGLAVIIAAIRPTPPRLSAALERVGTTSVTTDTTYVPTLENRVGSAVLRRFNDNPALKLPITDLRLIGMSVNRYLYQKVLCVAGGLILPFAFGLIFQILGLTAFYIPALFGLPLAFGAWFLPNLLVRDQAAATSAFNAARAYNASTADGTAAGLAILNQGGSPINGANVAVTRGAATVTVTVTGNAPTFVPGLTTAIDVTVTGPVERWVG